jgi:hypothetical protein
LHGLCQDAPRSRPCGKRVVVNPSEAAARNLSARSDEYVPCRRRLSYTNNHHGTVSVANHRFGDAAHQCPPYSPRPLLPITIRPVPRSSARWTISRTASPIVRCALATVPPAACTRSTSPSSICLPCCSELCSRSSSRTRFGSSTPSDRWRLDKAEHSGRPARRGSRASPRRFSGSGPPQFGWPTRPRRDRLWPTGS